MNNIVILLQKHVLEYKHQHVSNHFKLPQKKKRLKSNNDNDGKRIVVFKTLKSQKCLHPFRLGPICIPKQLQNTVCIN